MSNHLVSVLDHTRRNFLLALAASPACPAAELRLRARDLGLAPGVFDPGRLNAITDVPGVRVGHTTLIEGADIRTGVTAVLQHGRNLFQEKVAGAVFVGNAFGKLAGSTQVQELGTIETPIVLTNTLSVGTAVEAVVSWTLAQPGNEKVGSVNSLVGETNDGQLNDIRGLHVHREHVTASAKSGPVEEGAVGAGTGTVCFGWKGGIGTSSCIIPQQFGGYRLAARAVFGLARTGSSYSNGSGDFAIAFSTTPGPALSSEAMSPLFEAALETVEEAVYNSLLMATSMQGNGRTVEALPIAQVRQILSAHALTK